MQHKSVELRFISQKNSHDRHLELTDDAVKEVYVESDFMTFRVDTFHWLYAPSAVHFREWHEKFYFIATNVYMSGELWGGNFSFFRDANKRRLYSLSEREWALIVQNVSKLNFFYTCFTITRLHRVSCGVLFICAGYREANSLTITNSAHI